MMASDKRYKHAVLILGGQALRQESRGYEGETQRELYSLRDLWEELGRRELSSKMR